ncbi:MAG: hypothetical protein V2A62_00820 [Candidatus Woesearchaeota archaeon]
MLDKLLLRKLFGKVEIETILKRIRHQPLSQVERNYLSRSVRPKLRAIQEMFHFNLLKTIDPQREKNSRQEIISSLSHYGYDLISLSKGKTKQRKICLEELIILILRDFPEPRFIEAIPILLIKNKIDSFQLLELCTKYHLKNEIGFLVETALLIHKKEELQELRDYLKKNKDKEKRILGEEQPDKIKEFMVHNTPPRMLSWNLWGRYFDEDFINAAEGYL